MTFLMAILESVGPDVQIHSLNKTLGIPFCCKPQTFELDGAPLYVARLSIIDEELPEEIGVERTFNWLSLNIGSLVDIPGRLTLEIECLLALEDASRFLRIPVERLELLISLDCDLRFQFIKEFPPGIAAGN